MSEKKFLYRKTDDDYDEPEFLISQCLQVGSGVELKEIPTTGEEYLLKVIKERQKCTVVTKCDQDYSKFAIKQTRFVEELRHAKAPHKLKPTKEWQNIQVADFSDVRMYLSRLQTKKSSWPKVKKIKIDQSNVTGWKEFLQHKEPTLTCVLGLHHAMLDRGLEILTEILNDVKPGDTIDHKTGQWIYSFLACTKQPLLSDTTSILRNLARKCAEIRSHINQDDENAILSAAPLNIFICLVAQYFRQYDLAD